MNEKFHILYVDDERQNLTAFKASFRRDFEISLAQSGKEAIEIMRSTSIDMIISDQRMPEMTGVQLFERIVDEFPEPIRMVLTGYSDLNVVIDAINKGKVYHYATKPWKNAELKLVIDNALETYKLRRENLSLAKERNELRFKTEQQAKENLLSQFETLKNQVNPHFLFNCLNALASLVHDQPDLAEDFITKMTKVYRYLLEQKEEIVVDLKDEVKFLQDYFFLQKTRFADCLHLHIALKPEDMYRKVPPLTLQLLGENAVKHNIISRSQPLTIEVFKEGEDVLVIKNNYQKRIGNVDSTGIGLENLRARYGFLSNQKPHFDIEGNFYVARVPLLD